MDLLKIFRSKCVFCKEEKSLLRVIHPGYHTRYDYYHQHCLDKVINNPEENVKLLDHAIQISDQIQKDRLFQENLIRQNFEKIEKLKKLQQNENCVNKVLIEEIVEEKKIISKIDFINEKLI